MIFLPSQTQNIDAQSRILFCPNTQERNVLDLFLQLIVIIRATHQSVHSVCQYVLSYSTMQVIKWTKIGTIMFRHSEVGTPVLHPELAGPVPTLLPSELHWYPTQRVGLISVYSTLPVPIFPIYPPQKNGQRSFIVHVSTRSEQKTYRGATHTCKFHETNPFPRKALCRIT
jgi:hypothetical protein